MRFYQQEYWSVLPFLPPGDLSDPGIETVCLLHFRQILYSRATGAALVYVCVCVCVCTKSLGCVPETNTTLQANYTSVNEIKEE